MDGATSVLRRPGTVFLVETFFYHIIDGFAGRLAELDDAYARLFGTDGEQLAKIADEAQNVVAENGGANTSRTVDQKYQVGRLIRAVDRKCRNFKRNGDKDRTVSVHDASSEQSFNAGSKHSLTTITKRLREQARMHNFMDPTWEQKFFSSSKTQWCCKTAPVGQSGMIGRTLALVRPVPKIANFEQFLIAGQRVVDVAFEMDVSGVVAFILGIAVRMHDSDESYIQYCIYHCTILGKIRRIEQTGIFSSPAKGIIIIIASSYNPNQFSCQGEKMMRPCISFVNNE
uniref:Uncharacterized protein n=1 Tax=Romanomermis culicivorax TaxID=13658 RepID=A0A915HNE2_ROMCU